MRMPGLKGAKLRQFTEQNFLMSGQLHGCGQTSSIKLWPCRVDIKDLGLSHTGNHILLARECASM